uniref:Uncharacterized protein n=1 Tax=Vitrella brassicaformis TaxID=1169539 RepID=A0A7S1JPB4_9ALVE|mmetsp:Transcript_44806/g.126547  ORF Transcript_44806/g.126547 Transcript_44806/m.126547 type:complete len:129 (-) Transcript_44806:273-659(-)
MLWTGHPIARRPGKDREPGWRQLWVERRPRTHKGDDHLHALASLWMEIDGDGASSAVDSSTPFLPSSSSSTSSSLASWDARESCRTDDRRRAFMASLVEALKTKEEKLRGRGHPDGGLGGHWGGALVH